MSPPASPAQGGWHIALESPDQPEVLALIAALDVYQSALYPAESNHLLDLAALQRPEVIFAVVREADDAAEAMPARAAALAGSHAGAVIACGAVVMSPAQGGLVAGEIKRMFVSPACRGRGVARALMGALEQAATARGGTELRLETGIHQAEALALYARCGYVRCGPFADYIDDPLSVFMHKPMPPLAGTV